MSGPAGIRLKSVLSGRTNFPARCASNYNAVEQMVKPYGKIPLVKRFQTISIR